MCFVKASLIAHVVKSLPAVRETPGSIPGLGRSPGEENGNPLQYSCLENSMDKGAWQAIAHGSQRVRHECFVKDFHIFIYLFILG